MAKPPPPAPPRIVNRKARFSFQILDTCEAGISLTGSEVKSLRSGKASLEGAFAVIRDGQVFLRDADISPYPLAGYAQHQPKRERKLLLHRRQIRKLQGKVILRGLTLVPLALYFNPRGLAKVTLALARGKSQRDKRSDIRQRDLRRQIARAMRRHS